VGADVAGEDGEGFGEGFGAVADAVFHVGGEFAEGFDLAVGDEERVVAEAAPTLLVGDDDAVADAFDGIDQAVGIGDGDDAAEAGGTFFGGQAAEGGEEFAVVLVVAGFFAGVAGGADAGFAAEGIDFEAGIVGEGEAFGEGGGFDGFFDGIVAQRGGVLDDFGQAGDVVGGEQIEAEFGVPRADLLSRQLRDLVSG
jgi:hypothetical protein